MKIAVINGPNMNMLGIREPNIYGRTTYADLCKTIEEYCAKKGVEVEFFQSNGEGEIVSFIHKCYFDKTGGIVINPAAYTHYSYAIFDALKTVDIPAVEVHISDIEKREEFRRHSVVTPACKARIAGEGIPGYLHAVDILLQDENRA